MASYTPLPVDVLLPICRHLAEINITSVVAFALVCKEWEAIARTVLHRSISFVATSRTRLAYDVNECRLRLQRTASSKHVRCLEIAGPGFVHKRGSILQQRLTLYRPYEVENHASHPAPGWRFVPGYNDCSETLDEIRSDGRHPFSLYLENRTGQVKVWEMVPDSSWQPLASFIAQLPVLSDVVYNCASAVPPCILAALHQHRCRLHVNTFRVPDLHKTLSADFVQLITSPCLYSIRAAYLPTDSNLAVPGTEGYYDEEALMRLVAGLSIKLKKMTILRKAGGAIPVGTQKPPWIGFKVSGTRLPAFKRGSLQELALLHQDVISVENIEAWSAHTDFQVLVVLKISAPMSADALDFIAKIDLSSLTTLRVVIHRDNTSIDNTIKATSDLLLAVQPLSELRLEQSIQTLAFGQIIKHHGSMLQNLSLLPSKEYTAYHESWSGYYLPTSTMLQELRECCPQLEYLAISIRRSRGSSAEVQAYRTLGSLPKLRHLALTLDASDYSVLWSFEAINNDNRSMTGSWPPPPDDSSFNDFDQQIYPETFIYNGPRVRNGHIRDAFINCAIDEWLARAIFDEILAGRQSSQARLQCVQLQVMGGGEFTSQVAVRQSLATVVDELSRSWTMTRDCRDDGEDKMMVREVERHHSSQMRSGPWGHRELEEPVMSIFRRVWPSSREGNWRRKWHSYPLSST